MSKELIVSATSLETKVAIVEEDQVTEIFIERAKSKGILGNIYKGRVTKVLPGMQSAFVDIGLERDAFLYVSDFVEDYEEYEKMFTDAEQAAEKLLKVEIQEDHIQPDEPRRRGGRLRRGRRGRGERPERVEAGPPRPKGVEPPPREPETIEPPAEVVAAPQSQPPSRLQPVPEPPSVPDEAAAPGRQPGAAERPRQPDWLDEVRKAQAALAQENAGTGATHTSRHKPGDETAGEKDSEARVRATREVDEFSLPDDDSPATSEQTAEATAVAAPSHVEPSEAPSPEGPAPAHDRRRRRPRRPVLRRRPHGKNQHERHFSIDDLLREGQEIIVQVAKEPIAKKGARITSHIALPGRYVVYMPTVDHVGVSRKIGSDKERARLKEIVTRLRGESKRGFIVRTAGQSCEEKDLRTDLQYLTRLWEEIRQKGESASAPAVIHSELDLVPRLLRDYVSGDFRAIRVDDEQGYERIVEFIHKLDPGLVNRVKLYTKTQPIFDEYGIHAEIEKALKQKVWLKSGGYIVINQTEALVAIDVNTGKFVGRGDSLEETITRTNLDAVKEVVRQIRLRDLGGIIVIDFIDMDERRNRQKVMEALERELARDKSPTKILQFNEFGLVAITRKRVKQSLERTLCQPCPYCNGVGMVKSARTVCYSIHSEIKKLLPTLGDGDEIIIRVNPEVGHALREKERVVINEIQEMTGKDITIKTDPLLHWEQFDIVEA
ncbi:MAG: Rne/Rng family ribonuclease [Acidobacteria bacterium]|nr:Rne/Rng family ribonuclease [Acidobacteriota bacterium]